MATLRRPVLLLLAAAVLVALALFFRDTIEAYLGEARSAQG